ncbi:nitroreductase family protein [Antrihabitans sp. YC3-6]|uniref:Nitroreductase family protein n=1 Tax=Antrihabitans stalagmiti TaxID=2799499 RepID=A0A934NMC7_9NOCA|nr:nitroreductase family protein [Antrihabitans stalagmiti]MBJ8337842.1 nitroreductase family protein [Antrihabitans stalagmiti]
MTSYPVLDLTPDELLSTTRTVRKRLDLTRDVPIELIKECLQIALQAPSGSNRQAWQWIVVTDAETRARLGQIYRETTEAYLASRASAAKLFADDPERAKVQHRVGDSVAWLGERMGEVPVLVIPCIKAGTTLPAGNQAGLWGSLLPAAWSYALAARARGLGTAWTTLHLEREAEVAELLGIPPGYHQAALIPTAYYTGETFKPAAREPIDSVLHIDRW